MEGQHTSACPIPKPGSSPTSHTASHTRSPCQATATKTAADTLPEGVKRQGAPRELRPQSSPSLRLLSGLEGCGTFSPGSQEPRCLPRGHRAHEGSTRRAQQTPQERPPLPPLRYLVI